MEDFRLPKKNGGLSFDISFDLWVSLTKLKITTNWLVKNKDAVLKNRKRE